MMRVRLPPQLRSTVIYLVTIVLAQVTSFLLLPIITRFLDPSAYGDYARALAVASLMGMLGSSWIRNVGFRFYFDAKNEGTTRSFYWSLVTLQAGVLAGVFLIGIALLPRFSADLVALPTLGAAALMIVAADFQALTASFLRAEQQSGKYAAAEISAGLTRLAGTTLGLSLGFTQPSFLFLAAAAASVVGGMIAAASLAGRLTGPARLDLRAMRLVSGRAPGALPFSLGQWFSRQADRLVLTSYTTSAVVGTYAAGFGLSDRIVNGLGNAAFLMAWPDVLNAWNEGGAARARVAIRRYFQIYLWLTVGPVVALVVFGGAVVGLLLGPGYGEAAHVLGLVAGAAWLSGIIGGLNRHFELEKRYYALSSMILAGAALHLVLNLVLVPRYAAVGAGIAFLASQAALTVVAVLIRDRRLVSFPAADAGLLALVACGGVAGVLLMFGSTLLGFATFASLYAVTTAGFWTWRVRRGWSVTG